MKIRTDGRRHIARTVFRGALELLYPSKCPLCGALIDRDQDLCEACGKTLPHIGSCRCKICGRPVAEGEERCSDCVKIPHAFTCGTGAFLYEGRFRDALASLKYRGEADFGPRLGRLAAREAAERIRQWRPELLVPVPLHKMRYRERGYNQAERIAEGVADLTGIAAAENVLLRSAPTKALKELGAASRRETLRGAFSIRTARGREGRLFSPVLGKRILLIDDIYTTGSTLDSAAETLLAGGASEVFFLTVCIGRGFALR